MDDNPFTPPHPVPVRHQPIAPPPSPPRHPYQPYPSSGYPYPHVPHPAALPYPPPYPPHGPVMHPRAFDTLRWLFWWTIGLIAATVVLTVLVVLAPGPVLWMLLAGVVTAVGLAMVIVAIVMFSSSSGCPPTWRGRVVGAFVGALTAGVLGVTVAAYDMMVDLARFFGSAV